MERLALEHADQLADKFYSGEGSINDISEQYTREELCDFMRGKLEELAEVVSGMTPAQLAYRLPGRPGGPDSSGDEVHFDTSEIMTHLASGIAFHWWGITRALKHDRPQFPRAPEGVKVTGTKGSMLGGGGWSGATAGELISGLREMTDRFLQYIQSLPEDPGEAKSRLGNFSDLNPHSWLFLDAVHFNMHLKQIKTMQAQPDYPPA
jgi:hypothetical protein